jgi:hypothetical protein
MKHVSRTAETAISDILDRIERNHTTEQGHAWLRTAAWCGLPKSHTAAFWVLLAGDPRHARFVGNP